MLGLFFFFICSSGRGYIIVERSRCLAERRTGYSTVHILQPYST